MHIDIVPNRKSHPTVLLRETYREGKKVRKRTLANLSALSEGQIQTIRRALKGEQLVPAADLFEVTRSFHHGHVHAVRLAMRRLGFDTLLASRPCRERDLIVGLVTAQILEPDSKLATSRWWHTTTLPASLGLSEATVDDFYEALDWLEGRQVVIEKKLAARHLKQGGLVLYDLTSSYFEGKTCPLAALGHNRDGKKGKLQVNYGLITNDEGCPVAVSVGQGNTADPKTLLPQVAKLRHTFGIDRMVLVGDRGMISQKQIDALKDYPGLDWITALRSRAINELFREEHLQLGLFDEKNLFELSHPDYPDERLVACRNAELGKLRAHTRQSLLDATVKALTRIQARITRGTLRGKDKIGLCVGKVIHKYKVAKHFDVAIEDAALAFSLNADRIAQEATLDGIYVIRTSVPKPQLEADDAVRHYKALSHVERAFRSLKTIDLEVRPIRHHLETRVKAHIFLCMLAQYVVHHLIQAWRPLLFCDEDQAAKKSRDPVSPAKRSAKAMAKVTSKLLDDGSTVHSFQTLLKDLATIVRNVCRTPGADDNAPTFDVTTLPTAQQLRAYSLLETIAV